MEKVIEAISSLSAVASVSAWNDRLYISLANTSMSAKGDGRKIWIKGNVLTLESYKGYMSDGAIASLDELEKACEELGMTISRQ